MSMLLVIDDERSIRMAFQRLFEKEGIEVLTAGTGEEGLSIFENRQPDVVVVDFSLPEMSGIEVFEQIHAQDPVVPVLLITGHGTTSMAIEAIQQGAFDYLFKPLDRDELKGLVSHALRVRDAARNVVSGESTQSGKSPVGAERLVGRCSAMKNVYRDIGRVAAQDVNVLVLGESGTGKELVSHAIHSFSLRKDGPFMAINCAAIPDTLLESELFGHERGTFTGADQRRIGRFEDCAGGTLFLDEIGDTSPSIQGRLLRVLQERTFERLGSNETRKADVRVIAATNRNLEELTAKNEFRLDLYYRLSVFTIELPPLRERGQDIQLLSQHFLSQFAREFQRKPPQIAADTMTALLSYDWPGNVRELESALQQALLSSSGSVLLPDFLPDFVSRSRARPSPDQKQAGVPDLLAFVETALQENRTSLHGEVTQIVERWLVDRVQRHTQQNISQTARILGISRPTLRSRLRDLESDDNTQNDPAGH
jgi:two-component system, NtrC family, response regulator AtoC